MTMGGGTTPPRTGGLTVDPPSLHCAPRPRCGAVADGDGGGAGRFIDSATPAHHPTVLLFRPLRNGARRSPPFSPRRRAKNVSSDGMRSPLSNQSKDHGSLQDRLLSATVKATGLLGQLLMDVGLVQALGDRLVARIDAIILLVALFLELVDFFDLPTSKTVGCGGGEIGLYVRISFNVRILPSSPELCSGQPEYLLVSVTGGGGGDLFFWASTS
ncbi:hypothetical protein G5I_13285 [Acromyrmex echinatior]|uniref:Uncharacterized protein n=1 Tax=Acromyrmex echinatior TaxID=103372 RepID=F4X4L9_ACREC|nr:hypothetical protein G5I_13285 [Acromyrmex echinatior]